MPTKHLRLRKSSPISCRLIGSFLMGCFLIGVLTSGATAADSFADAKRKADAEKRFRAAVEVLNTSSDAATLHSAMETLRRSYPESRTVLVRESRRGRVRAKVFALRVLGDLGNVEDDLAVVAEGLWDASPLVRRSAVGAVRSLGDAGASELVRYLRSERDARNRQLAIKTLGDWKVRLEALVALLATEKDETTQRALIRSLERATGARCGKDVTAWENVLRQRVRERSRFDDIDNPSYSSTSKVRR